MDVLNFISWIKNGQQVTTVDPTQTLLPLGLRDPRRDDGYRSGTITAQDFINSVAPPAIVAVGTGTESTVRTGLNNTVEGYRSVVFGACNTINTNAAYSAILSGRGNTNLNEYSVIASGCQNYNVGNTNIIGGGVYNCTTGGYGFLGGGSNNSVTSLYGVVSGGAINYSTGCAAAITGGFANTGSGNYSYLGGGCCNSVCFNGLRSGILGGHFNQATCSDSFVVGSCITTNRACTAFVNNLSIMNIPTSSAGLPSKAVWSNGGVLTIVP
jgi:hypothetical protein